MEAYAENEEIPAENPAFGLLQKGTVIEFEHRATRVVVKAKVQSFQDRRELVTKDSKSVVLIRLKPLKRSDPLLQEYIYNYDAFSVVNLGAAEEPEGESRREPGAESSNVGEARSSGPRAPPQQQDPESPTESPDTQQAQDRRMRMRVFQQGHAEAKDFQPGDEITSDSFPGTLQIIGVLPMNPPEMDTSQGIFHGTPVCQLHVSSRNPQVNIPKGTQIRSDEQNLAFVARRDEDSAPVPAAPPGRNEDSAPVPAAPAESSATSTGSDLSKYQPEAFDGNWKRNYEEIEDRVEKFEKLNRKLHALFRGVSQAEVADDWGKYLIEELRSFREDPPDQNIADIAQKHCIDMGVYFYERPDRPTAPLPPAQTVVSATCTSDAGLAADGGSMLQPDSTRLSLRSSSVRWDSSFGNLMGGMGAALVKESKSSLIHFGGMKRMENPWEHGGRSPYTHGLQTKGGDWKPPKDSSIFAEKHGRSYLIPYTKNKVVQSKEHTDPIAEGYNASEDNRCYITVRMNSDDWHMSKFKQDVNGSYVAHAFLLKAVWRNADSSSKWLSVDQLYELTDNRIFFCALMFRCSRQVFDGRTMMLGVVVEFTEMGSPMFQIAMLDSASIRFDRQISTVESSFFKNFASPEDAVSVTKEVACPMIEEWLCNPVFNSSLCRWIGVAGGRVEWICFKKQNLKRAIESESEQNCFPQEQNPGSSSLSSSSSNAITISERRRPRRVTRAPAAESERRQGRPSFDMTQYTQAAVAMLGQACGQVGQALQATSQLTATTPVATETEMKLREDLAASQLQSARYEAEADKNKALLSQQEQHTSAMLTMSERMSEQSVSKVVGGIMMGSALASGNLATANSFAVGLGSSSSEPSNQSETSRIPTITASASPKRTFSPAPMMLTSGADMNGAAEMLSPTSKLLDDANKLAEKAAKKRKHYDMSKEPRFLEQAEKLEKEVQDLRKQALARSPC